LPPTGTGGQPPPAIASWRIGYAASPPNAGFRIRRKSYSISPGGMIPEPIVSVAKLLPDDRRVARMGLVGDGWVAGIHNVAADHQALAPSTLSSCRSRPPRRVALRRLQWLAGRRRPDLAEDRLQDLNAGRKRIAIGVYGVGQ
jgi:hypothetical protein